MKRKGGKEGFLYVTDRKGPLLTEGEVANILTRQEDTLRINPMARMYYIYILTYFLTI